MPNAKLSIATPKGFSARAKSKGGTAGASLQWAADFGKKRTQQFTNAQIYIDKQVLAFCNARVPVKTQALMNAGTKSTVLGSGEVVYSTPYARTQYYSTQSSREYDSNRGALWFERGKAAETQNILAGVQRIIGGQK